VKVEKKNKLLQEWKSTQPMHFGFIMEPKRHAKDCPTGYQNPAAKNFWGRNHCLCIMCRQCRYIRMCDNEKLLNFLDCRKV